MKYRTFIKYIDNSECQCQDGHVESKKKKKKNNAECLYYFIILKIFNYFNFVKVKKLVKKC